MLRYGENPHQQGALYRWVGAAPLFEQLQGKELSYNNIVDLEAAWAMPQEFAEPAIAIIKHTNPSGLATAATLVAAYQLALACDPVSAFGSIIAANRTVDRALVEAIGSLFVEVLVAPDYTKDALEWLAQHKKNCRVLIARPGGEEDLVLRSVRGGLLAQTPDTRGVDESTWRVVTQRAPTAAERKGLTFAWLAVKHVKSNAIVLVRSDEVGQATEGVGAGQKNRVDSVYLAARRAGERERHRGRSSRGGHGLHSAGRLPARRGGHRRRRPPGNGDDLHGGTPFSSLRAGSPRALASVVRTGMSGKGNK